MASASQLRIPKDLKADCIALLPSASFLLSYTRVPPGCDINNSLNIIRFILPVLWPLALPIIRVLCLHCLSSCAPFALGIFRVVLPVHVAWTPNDSPILDPGLQSFSPFQLLFSKDSLPDASSIDHLFLQPSSPPMAAFAQSFSRCRRRLLMSVNS